MPLHTYPYGVIIESGLEDWQIVQRDSHGWGSFSLRGRVVAEVDGRVEARIVEEDTGVPVTQHHAWRPARMTGPRTWELELSKVPSGGLYRVETRWRQVGRKEGEWSIRGDVRRFLGVGDLWVIAGQSNSAGYGRGYYNESLEPGLHLFGNNHRWSLASQPLNDTTDSRQVVSDDAANNGHSPYLEVARILKKRLHYPIGLIQSAVGGTPLSDWNPLGEEPGILYTQLSAVVQQVGGKIKGVFWYQGENEATRSETALAYQRDFVATVKAWRRKLNHADLPVLTVQLNRYHMPAASDDNELGWSLLREAQRQAVHQVDQVYVTSSLDLPLSDFIHTSPAGHMALARRLAQTALGGVYGQSDFFLCPEIFRARRTHRGRRLELTFRNVSSRLDTVDVTAQPFLVVDSEGDLQVTAIEYPAPTKISLHLSRIIRGAATVQVGGGMSPPTVPMDFERATPLLAFHGFNIE